GSAGSRRFVAERLSWPIRASTSRHCRLARRSAGPGAPESGHASNSPARTPATKACHSLALKRSTRLLRPFGSFVSLRAISPLGSFATATHSPLPLHKELTRHVNPAVASPSPAPLRAPFIGRRPLSPVRVGGHLATPIRRLRWGNVYGSTLPTHTPLR